MRLTILILLAFTLMPLSQVQDTAATPEATSLLGVKLFPQADEKGEIKAAEEKLAASPKNIELLIALGRAQANSWHYRDAIATYTRGMEKWPKDARLYRHRGHRYITLREFDKAVKDLQRANELSPKDYDILYHLGLALYLKGEFSSAEITYRDCYEAALALKSDDSIVAVTDWFYMALRRQGKQATADGLLVRITPQMGVKENKSYYERLLFYKGLKQESDLVNMEKATDLEIATIGYGVGNWHFYNDDPARAEEYFRRIVSGKYWPAFGFIAAEVELAKLAPKRISAIQTRSAINR